MGVHWLDDDIDTETVLELETIEELLCAAETAGSLDWVTGKPKLVEHDCTSLCKLDNAFVIDFLQALCL